VTGYPSYEMPYVIIRLGLI